MNGLLTLITNNELNNLIEKENKEQLDISFKVIDEFIPKLLVQLNDLDGNNKEINTINQAIFILFSQINMTYKSTLLLLLNGYLTNAFVNLRNMIDAYFNMRFIGSGKHSKQLKRAESYLSVPDRKWTKSTVQDRATTIQEKNLYHIYEIVCSYSHANYLGASHHFDGAKITIEPSEEKIKESITLTNTLFLYCTDYIVNRYSLDASELDIVMENDEISKLLDTISYERLVKSIFKMLFGEAQTDDELNQFVSDYLKHEKQ